MLKTIKNLRSKEYTAFGIKFHIRRNGIDLNDFEQIYVADLREEDDYRKFCELLDDHTTFYEQVINANSSKLPGWKPASHIFLFIVAKEHTKRSLIFSVENFNAKTLFVSETSFKAISEFFPDQYCKSNTLPINKIQVKKRTYTPDIFNLVYGLNGTGKSKLMEGICKYYLKDNTCLITPSKETLLLSENAIDISGKIFQVVYDAEYCKQLSYSQCTTKGIAQQLGEFMARNELNNSVIVFDSAADSFDSHMLNGLFDIIYFLGLSGSQVFFTTANMEIAGEFYRCFNTTARLQSILFG